MAYLPKRYSGSNPMAYRISATSFGNGVEPGWLPEHDAATRRLHVPRQTATSLAVALGEFAFAADSSTRPTSPGTRHAFSAGPTEAEASLPIRHPRSPISGWSALRGSSLPSRSEKAGRWPISRLRDCSCRGYLPRRFWKRRTSWTDSASPTRTPAES